MKFNLKKLTSLLTASLLTAGGLVGLSAVPANAADAPAPALLLNYETETLVASPWPSLPGYQFSGNGDDGWVNYVPEADKPGGSAGSTKMLKTAMGSGSYSGTFIAKTTTNSLLSAAHPVVSMKIWAPAAGKVVRMTIQNGDHPNVLGAKTIDATTTVVGWQTLHFDFSSANPDYTLVLNRAFIDYDPTQTTNGPDIFIDDVSFNGAATPVMSGHAPAPALLLNYETETLVASPWPSLPGYQFSGNGDDGWVNYVPEADKPGGSAGSTKMLKTAMGSGSYSGTFLAKTTTNSLLSAAAPVITMKFWAPAAGKVVRMTVQSGDHPNILGAKSVDANALTVAGWQTLRFNFSSANPDYTLVLNRAIIDYDPAQTTNGPDVYIDDVSFNETGVSAPLLVALPATSSLIDFSEGLHSLQSFESTVASLAVPSQSANACSTAVKITKGANPNFLYSVARVASFTDRKVLTSANPVLTVNMYAPAAGRTVLFKLAQPNTGPGIEKQVTTTQGWQRITLDFSTSVSTSIYNESWNPNVQYRELFVGVDFTINGTGDNYYFDDFAFNGAATPALGTLVDCAFTPLQFDQDNKGRYPHVRLEKSLLNEKLDGTWWDGVWQNRDADTRAYLKYIPVGSTFALTYHVTDEYGSPYVGAKVSLIVNANYSCAKTFFAYEGSLIGPDDCAGGGETELPAKTVGADGRVTFVLTNTNTTGEAMPADLNGAPNPATKEVGTNIKPNVVGAKQQGIDMMFAHFVEPSGMSKATGPAAKTATIGSGQISEFTLTDAAGMPLSNTDVKYFVNGFDSKSGLARTDAAGKVRITSTNSVGLEGMQTVGVSLDRDGKLPLAATATINWMAPELSIAAAGAANSVVVKVAGASGKTVKITIAGKVYTRVAKSANASFTIATGAGKKAVKVSVSGKSLSKSVAVTRK